MSNLVVSVLFLGFGTFLAVHCGQATFDEYRSGRAMGGRDWGDYDRNESPIGFWTIMAGNAGASIMGLAIALFGGIMAIKQLGVLL